MGRYLTMEDGARIAFLSYANVTHSRASTRDIVKEFSAPELQFFMENTGALAVISRGDHRLLYYNRAIERMLKPMLPFDSNVTFEQFFGAGVPGCFQELFELVDAGPRTVREPKTHRLLEANVVSSAWNRQPSYVIYLYEHNGFPGEGSPEASLRHQRVAFNHAVLSGEHNLLPYHQNGSRGYWVWNLTEDHCVMAEGGRNSDYNALSLLTFQQATQFWVQSAVLPEDRAFGESCTRNWLMQAFESGSHPRSRSLLLQTERGRISVTLDFRMMRSPDTGDLYLKISEENVTHQSISEQLLKQNLEHTYDYLAYIDLLSDECRLLYAASGRQPTREITLKIHEHFDTLEGAAQIQRLFGASFPDPEAWVESLERRCGPSGEFSTVYETPEGRLKNVTVWRIDAGNRIYSLRGHDVTLLLQSERQREQALELAVREAREKVERLSIQTVLSISRALDARDGSTCRHSQRVAYYAAQIAHQLKWSRERVHNLYNIALVHDIGKIGIPDALLQKCGALTPEEFEQVKQHVVIGSAILRDFTSIGKGSEVALYHHERFDGTGYTAGLHGEQIPLEARIIALADAVDAMNSVRPYRQRQSQEYILSEIRRESGRQFDPSLADIMLTLIEKGLLTNPVVPEGLLPPDALDDSSCQNEV